MPPLSANSSRQRPQADHARRVSSGTRGVVLDGPDEAELPVGVLGGEGVALIVGEGRPVPGFTVFARPVVHPDVVHGDPAGVVGVGLPVGDGRGLEVPPRLPRLRRAEDDLEVGLVVALGPPDGGCGSPARR